MLAHAFSAAILAGGASFAEVPAVRHRRPNDPIRHSGRRKNRVDKDERLRAGAFPRCGRKVAYMPAPPKGFIYVRDESKSGMVPKLVRRG